MVVDVSRDEVRTMVAEGAQLVEVLPEQQYRKKHLPGAINIPLGELDRERARALLRRESPIIVYCHDYQ